MNEPRTARWAPLAGTAAAGIVLGHWLAYLLAVPHADLRAEVLSSSGHAYWFVAVRLGVVLFICALGAVAFRCLGDGLASGAPSGERLSWLAHRLWVLQILGFTAMEVVERIVAGASVASLFQHHVLVVGLAVQVLVAFAGALVLLWFGRAAARLIGALRRSAAPRSEPRPSSPSGPFQRRRPLTLAGAAGLRGPPSP